MGDLEGARRRRVRIDLRITFIREDQEIEAPREFDGFCQVVQAGYGALRVGRRPEIEGCRALEQTLVHHIEVRQEPRFAPCREIDGLSARGSPCGSLGLEARVWD